MRFYDWRHTVATKLFANPDVSEGTAIAVLGHVSPRMIRKVYNHSKHDVMRAAVETLERKPKPPISPKTRFAKVTVLPPREEG